MTTPATASPEVWAAGSRRSVAPSTARRTLDVACSLTALLVFLPLFALLWILIRLTSRGPAIYRQVRVGQGRELFTIYKFRTMRLNNSGPAVTAPGDPRVTRLGRILRRTSLDELPQLANILLGQMTLVGARPETPDLASRYPEPWNRVFDFRPGLTGPSQLTFRDEDAIPPDVDDLDAFYLDVLVPQKVNLDLDFLEQDSLAETIRWIIATLGEISRVRFR
jgi:lipopolysaccharide/colanic/teichoic acid biosynthesis glycosyltransferase